MLNKILAIFFLLTLTVSGVVAQDDSNEALKEVDVIVGLEKIITLDFVPNSILKIANEN